MSVDAHIVRLDLELRGARALFDDDDSVSVKWVNFISLVLTCY